MSGWQWRGSWPGGEKAYAGKQQTRRGWRRRRRKLFSGWQSPSASGGGALMRKLPAANIWLAAGEMRLAKAAVSLHLAHVSLA